MKTLKTLVVTLCVTGTRGFSEIRFDLLDLCEDGLHFSLIV